MIKADRLALYCALKDMGACESAEQVLDDEYWPKMRDIRWLLDRVGEYWLRDTFVAMLHLLPESSKMYFLERLANDCVLRWVELKCADNTLYLRYQALLFSDCVGADDLPF